MKRKKPNKNYDELKGKDYRAIIASVDNKWEMITAIWLCKNKEAKSWVMRVLLLVVGIFLAAPEIPAAIKSSIMGLFK